MEGFVLSATFGWRSWYFGFMVRLPPSGGLAASTLLPSSQRASHHVVALHYWRVAPA